MTDNYDACLQALWVLCIICALIRGCIDAAGSPPAECPPPRLRRRRF